MKLGIFGGTFDPPHHGHLILAAEAQFQLKLDRVLWVLTPDPPHKPNHCITPFKSRLELLQAAIAGNPNFELSRVDIDRSPPHYAVDTVLLMRAQHPKDELVYLMGGDSLHDLPCWFHPREFLQACDAIGVMRRPGDNLDLRDLEISLPQIIEKIRILDTPLIEISSTFIRQRIATGGPFQYYLPAPVYELIKQRQLYQLSS